MELILVLNSILIAGVFLFLLISYHQWKRFIGQARQQWNQISGTTADFMQISSSVIQQLHHIHKQQQQILAQLREQSQMHRQCLSYRQVIERSLQRQEDQIRNQVAQLVNRIFQKLEQWFFETIGKYNQQHRILEQQSRTLQVLQRSLSEQLARIIQQLEATVLSQQRASSHFHDYQRQLEQQLEQQIEALQQTLQKQMQTVYGFFGSIERDVHKLLSHTREFGKLSKIHQQWTISVSKHIKSSLQNLRQIYRAIDRLADRLFYNGGMKDVNITEETKRVLPSPTFGGLTQEILTDEIENLLRELTVLHQQLEQRLPHLDQQLLASLESILSDIDSSASNLLERLRGHTTPSTYQVLVLEDSQVFQERLQNILERRGYQVLVATSVDEAQRILETEIPNIMLLDIELPDGNGLQLCQQLRQQQEFQRVPILFISALTDREVKIQGFRAGADDYIPKPFDELELVARIERHLELAQSRQALSEGLFSMIRILEAVLQLQQIFLQLVQQLSKARAEAEQANQAKSIFLASMSHELRTPLNAILGFAQILRQDPNLSPKQREYVETMYRSGNHLLQMINDILDLSKIEAGKIQLLPVDIELAQFVEDLRGMFHLRCQEKGLWLKFEVDPQLPQYIVADAQKLRQVLINLIGNAVKFTAQGGITVRVRQVTDSEGEPRIRWEVEDTGRGIPKEQLEKIMEPFHQVEAMVSEGTGLGLTISRALVALMGGQLQVRSQVGEGSVFFFDIPLKTPVAAMPEVHKTTTGSAVPISQRLVAAKPATVLIVDDSRTNRKILREFLSEMNITCVEVENGWKAWKLIQDPQHAFDVVLTDIVMPEMNGIELVKRIRSAEQEGEHLPIIGITASVLQLSNEELLEIGFDAVLHKPFKLEDLVRLLQEKTSIELVEVEEQPVETKASVTMEEIQQWFSELPEAVQEQLIDAMLVQDLDAIATALSSLESDHPVVQFLQQKVRDGDVVYFSKLSMQLT